MAPQPTFPIKKSDGTIVRVTMAEFKAIQASKNLAPAPAKPADHTPAAQPPMRGPRPILPARPQPKREQPQPLSKLTADDFVTTDSVQLPTDSVASAGSARRFAEADAIVAAAGITVPVAQAERLRGVIERCFKDLLSYAATKALLTAAVADGGFGVSMVQADTIIAECKKRQHLAAQEDVPVPLKSTLPKILPPKNFVPGAAMLPARSSTEQFPATTTPFNAFKHSPLAGKKSTFPPQPPVTLKTAATLPAIEAESQFSLGSRQAAKPVIRDISPAPSMEVGPVEEIRQFTLTDLRRLSPKPAEGCARLRQKFMNLKEESILVYLDALQAWRISPLYSDYITALAETLAARQHLSAHLADRKKIQSAEVEAIIEMEKQLSV